MAQKLADLWADIRRISRSVPAYLWPTYPGADPLAPALVPALILLGLA